MSVAFLTSTFFSDFSITGLIGNTNNSTTEINGLIMSDSKIHPKIERFFNCATTPTTADNTNHAVNIIFSPLLRRGSYGD